ncbi:unnamed protein product [Arabidopsis thaliana]|uniref:(thale cress) hypothetical protein n=1 Tax=Arabidopsis thaliana TaxID=3702 RepID=A0A7G2E203_ARATH|nr:unnamed protein product [Arabidopsis thaliana]
MVGQTVISVGDGLVSLTIMSRTTDLKTPKERLKKVVSSLVGRAVATGGGSQRRVGGVHYESRRLAPDLSDLRWLGVQRRLGFYLSQRSNHCFRVTGFEVVAVIEETCAGFGDGGESSI